MLSGVREPAPSRRPRGPGPGVAWLLSIATAIALVVILLGQLPGADVRPGATAEPSAVAYASGLPWSSGTASSDIDGFAAWRGRPVDNVTAWPNRETWEVIRNPDAYGAVSRLAGRPMLTIGIAMLPEQETASFARCAQGDYDADYRALASQLVRLERGNAIVRLGWEANGDWYAWSIGNDVENYKLCFRRQVFAMRSVAPGLRMDWNMNKETMLSRSVADAYPGDDVVDIVGVDFYDMYPAYTNQAEWDADYWRTYRGGPRGIGTWLQFARDHRKQLSVPEWGLNTGASGGTDSAFFIAAMHRFFQENSRDIAYESYFNLQDKSFMILPPGVNPRGSEQYRASWRP